MDTDTILIIVGVVILALIAGVVLYKIYKYRQKKGSGKPKTKNVKVKKDKKGKEAEKIDLKGSYVDLTGKFLFRKELKILVLINHILPKGYLIFPKIGADLIMEPVGSRNLYNSICGKYIDFVIFEEATMKPRVAIDVYDGSIGDEQLNIESPEVITALESAQLPIVSIKIKSDYSTDEIKNPIWEALGLMDKKEGDK
jgi:hypothetical protein